MGTVHRTADVAGWHPGCHLHRLGGTRSRVANVTLIQDWENPDSLFNFCLAHAGETLAAEYTPVAGGGDTAARITIVPPTIGGAVGVFVESTLAMGSDAPVPTFPIDVAATATASKGKAAAA